ncbi:MAG: TolC family protein [Nitrospirae bacterium]|nr:TolC family protein [Nitrospirota bacterium]
MLRIKFYTFNSLYCLILIFCCLLPATDLLAAERLELTLKDAISVSIKENLSLASERINSKIADADIKFRKGEFDPAVELKAIESYRKYPSASLLTGTEERILNADISLGGKINTGTKYEIKWTNERIRNNSGYLRINPYYTSELMLTLNQPILKGLGKNIQETSLNVSKNKLEISRLNLDDKSIRIIADTANAYWDLVFKRHNLEVAEISLKLAHNVSNEVKARIESGTLAPVEIYKSEAETSLREEALLRAQKSVSDAEDKLRVVMNLKDWKTKLIPIEKLPFPSDIQPEESAIDTAIKNRTDYKQAIIENKNRKILTKYYDNQKYPDLEIIGALGLNGMNGTYNNTIDRLNSQDYYSWQFGLSLRIPIGNREAEGKFLEAKNEEERSDLNLKIIEQNITAEVRASFREVQLASEAITTVRKTRIAAEKRLEAEEGRFKVGMATLNDILKFQEEYAKSLSSEKKAAVDYARAVVEFERVKGTLGQDMPLP